VPERLADAQLAVTELVANAVVHGTGDIRLRLRVEGGRLYGEVIDDGGGFEHAIRKRTPSDVTGRGLGIVAALADEWGIHEGSTHVWFALDVTVRMSGTTDPQLGDERRPHGLA
jgi:anti-sigma regulatory factor (Ser/Thr protein kinase)